MNEKIGLFYGSDTGNTEAAALRIVEILGHENVDLYDIYDTKPEQFHSYRFIIIGLSTWHDGELQSDWDSFFDDLKEIDFTGKTVALFGLGDQVVYSHYFIDGVGIIGQQIYENGGNIVGVWSTEGYGFDDSKAEFKKGWFLGLALDEDNESHLTEERIINWLDQVMQEFNDVNTEKELKN
ncbi:flavodoxin [Fulvivirgaceae bacterium BMA10]|uniref:Flavodoxin n=1 Tax=Splendidivirga corallicola TaxID=3051826 RepID=A0ABT8KZK3_9BACT|nr:flavodoxin [Fulvivirgaceae bacterium BMA10]